VRSATGSESERRHPVRLGAKRELTFRIRSERLSVLRTLADRMSALRLAHGTHLISRIRRYFCLK